MEDEEEETVEEPSFAEDPRVQFIGSRLAHSLRLQEDKWNAFLEEEAKQQLLADFFEHSRPALLAFCLPRAGGLAAGSKVKNWGRRRTLWFSRLAGFCFDTFEGPSRGFCCRFMYVFKWKVNLVLLNTRTFKKCSRNATLCFAPQLVCSKSMSFRKFYIKFQKLLYLYFIKVMM